MILLPNNVTTLRLTSPSYSFVTEKILSIGESVDGLFCKSKPHRFACHKSLTFAK